MKKIIIVLLMAAISCSVAVAADKQAKKADKKEAPKGYIFTDKISIPTTSIKNQFRSGTCWCFSALSYIENEIMRAGGAELDLSEMWIVRNIYFEKAVK